MNLLVISPHRDDAAFSLSLAMERWISGGHRVHLLNVFTRSAYTPYATEDGADEEHVKRSSALRLKEDKAFLRCMPGLTMTGLGLDDAPLRLHCAVDSVCSVPELEDDPATARIHAALHSWMQADRGDHALILPLALGGHVDHRAARDAALAQAERLPCAFYEDLPYAMRSGARKDLASLRRRVRQKLTPVLSAAHPHACEFKLRLASLYASQIDGAMARSIAAFSEHYGGAERLWANAAWQALAAANHLSVPQRNPRAYPLPA